MTVVEMVRMGGIARAKAHSKVELRNRGRQGARPRRLGRSAVAQLMRMLAEGRSQAKCAMTLCVCPDSWAGRSPNKIEQVAADQVGGTEHCTEGPWPG